MAESVDVLGVFDVGARVSFHASFRRRLSDERGDGGGGRRRLVQRTTHNRKSEAAAECDDIDDVVVDVASRQSSRPNKRPQTVASSLTTTQRCSVRGSRTFQEGCHLTPYSGRVLEPKMDYFGTATRLCQR